MQHGAAGVHTEAPRSEPIGTRAALGLAALAAALTVLAHPPAHLWPLAFVMLAPLVAVLEGSSARRGFFLTHLCSAGMGLGIGYWLIHALSGEYEVPRLAAWSFTVLLVAALALVPATAAALYCSLRPRVGLWSAPLLFAAAWVLGEWVRGALLGVPWILLGLAVHRFPLALQSADLGGTWAVGFIVATVAAGFGVAARHRHAAPLATALAVAALAAGYGAWRLGAAERAGASSVRVAVVQAALPPSERFRAGSAERNVRRHAELTRLLAGGQSLDLVVWAETAVDTDLDAAPELRELLKGLVTTVGTPLVTGAPRSAGGVLTNSVVLFAPGRGLVESYAKQRLVPFSEYDPPLAGLLEPLLGPLMQGTPYEAGQTATVFREGPVSLAAPVCFEITYPDLVRGFRRGGAQVLLNLSNDAWFGRTGYPEMHLAHAVLRAIETRSWVVRAANTGISALVDPAGRIEAELPLFEEGSLVGAVHPAGALPLYGRVGDAPVVAILLAVLAAGFLRARRAGSPGPPRPRPRRRAATP